MERIVRAGQYIFHVSFSREDGEAPLIQGIDALCELILFEGAVPIPYERLDTIKVTDAQRFSVDMEGKHLLYNALVDALSNIPKSDPTLQTSV